MNYTEALEYIHSVSWKGSRPGLERITELCSSMCDPQKGMRFVHVTGTNGKGSTCAMTESILRAAGYHTGLFTSPYVRDFCERIMLDGVPVEHSVLADATEYVKSFAEKMTDKPTEFELITAIAFKIFRDAGCDVVVLEVGMGGRLDSTNIIEAPLLSVITGISLDHTAILGDTVAKIAKEKAGIIKPGCKMLYCGSDIFDESCAFGVREAPKKEPDLSYDDTPACDVVMYEAERLNVDFSFCDYRELKIKKADLDGAVFDYKGFENVEIPLLGLYQPQNSCRAIEVALALRDCGLHITDANIYEGLRTVVWRARFEKFSSEPVVLYDGGHNPEGISAAIETLLYYFPEQKLNLLTGVMADKDYQLMARELSPLIGRVFAVTPDNPRSLPSEQLAAVYRNFGIESYAFSTVDDGYKAALADSTERKVPLICLGSLYMYAEVAEAAGR